MTTTTRPDATSAVVPAPAPAPAGPTTAVVTGIGAASPIGLGREAWWQAVLRGESGIRPIQRFDASRYPSRLAGEILDFDDEAHIPGRLLPQTDRMTRLSLFAADEALADAGVDPRELPEYASGVATASSAGGFEFGQRELQALWSKGSQYVSVYQSFAWFYAVNTGQISIRHQLRGASTALVTEQAGGLDAVGQARRQLRKGAGMQVAGGVDSVLCPWGWTAYLAGSGLTPEEQPELAYLPFDPRARGHVPGEGGALLVLESEETAAARGVRGYGRITGYAATFDPPPSSGGAPGLRRAAELALADAGLGPEAVDAVFADAAGELRGDLAEAAALRDLFGPRGVPVTAPKTMTGRLAAGGAALDLAAALLAVRDGVIPPTVHTRPDPAHDLDLVLDTPRAARLRTVLVLARGRGGFNSAVVVRASD